MRKGKPQPRRISGDLRYNDIVVAKFINFLMQDGKKNIAVNILYKAFDIIEEKTKQKGYKVFKEALENTSPKVELKSRRMRGVTNQVPIPTRPERKLLLASNWLIASALKKQGNMASTLATTLIQASKGEGDAIQKKETMYKMAQANKSFSHFKF